jgi:hypothetical protein
VLVAFSGEAKTGLFEAVTVLVGSVAISVFLIAALLMPLATQLPAARKQLTGRHPTCPS